MSTRSHRKKTSRPQLVVSATVSAVSHTSHDTRRVRTRFSTITDGASAGGGGEEPFWADDIATNAARQAEDFSYQLGDNALESRPDDQVADGISVVVPKATRNTNSDRPMRNWWVRVDEYLEESLRREGRGSARVYGRCAGSRCADPLRVCPNRVCDGLPEWRCVDQACAGEAMYCRGCIVAIHARLPTHFVERWNGTHFERKRNWLKILNLRVQLGHPPGVICPFRQPAAVDFVLYDLSGVHEVNVDFCGCRQDEAEPDERRVQLMRAGWWPATTAVPNTCATFSVVKQFQTLNCLGKLSAFDFVRGLEKCTEHDGLDPPPDRRRPFMLILRQWRDVKRLKRAKRGHAISGVMGTALGELALPCRACPQPGWNLPEGWENIDPLFRFLYFIFLAVDANFRLSNRVVSSEAADPVLGDGWGYFCQRYGEEGYNAHVAKHAGEEELSNCSGFQAMFLANSKRTKGLRATGVVGVTCARHNMWRPNGIGDLQVGERQCNVDFVVVSAIFNIVLLYLIISYDIACQYAIHFWTRMSAFPARLQPRVAPSNVWWKVPNFHLPAHKQKCHSPYSFHWMPGAGMSHGEGIEQNWSASNGAAGSTRLMSQANRAITLEDIFGFHNYDRTLAMHRILPHRLAVAIKEGTAHAASFEAFSKGLEVERPEQVEEWREWVERWESTQHTTAEDSPFEFAETEGKTLRDIQLQIASEEFVATGAGVEVEREHTPGTFISLGLDIEQTQRKLAVDIAALKEPSPSQKLAFTKRRTGLLKQIRRFRTVQRIYMPSVRGALTDNQKAVLDGMGDRVPEEVRLFMPSEIVESETRERVCAAGLPDVEARMREGEASEALEGVRRGLRTRTMTNRFKIRHFTGQGLLTRGQGMLRVINVRIHLSKLRYRYSRAALLALRGHGSWEERLRVLADDDVRALNERALTNEEKAQNEHWAELGGAIVEGGVARAAGVAAGEGSHTLSWIWYRVGSGEAEGDELLEEALRVEWCKAYARTKRYDEEVRLVREEMRRTIAYGVTAEREWRRLAGEELAGATAELTEGRRAYAVEHAETERARCADLEKRWRPILRKADVYLKESSEASSASGEVTVEVDMQDEVSPEEEEARLEGEEGL
ncbi:CxC2 domain-containing protein [Favolaschia claudopus]|uniref:CxC2 domain-containing protein n=1 Tax=Favolaschia claudopus TaxID=2862362 RepID=A0AAV9Z6X3_9AGAR